MAAKHVELNLNLRRSSIVVDGVDLADALTSVTLTHGTGNELPKLVMEMRSAVVTSIAGEADVTLVIADADRAALTAAGWTAPEVTT